MSAAEERLEATLAALRGLQEAPSPQNAQRVLQDWEDRQEDAYFNASERR